MRRTDIEKYLNVLGKTLKKECKNTGYQIELIIVGGASIILNYSFRESSNDIDAYTDKLISIKEVINKITDEYKLNAKWLNSDFTKTTSFSKKLRQCAKPYKIYHNTLRVYTVAEEYLICMKLIAFRIDRHDLDDIVGIIKNSENNITYDKIDAAMIQLYGSWDRVSDNAKLFIKSMF